MFKMPITYLGFDGKEKTRDFYFNLTKGEIAEIHLSLPGGFDGFLNRLDDDPNPADVITVFKELILKSYGKRTADNKFIKSTELSQEFAATDAYSELLFMFLDDKDNFANKFLEGVINAPVGTIQKIIDENPKLKEAKEDSLSSDF